MDIWPRYFYFSYINVSSITFLDFVPLVCLFVLVPVPHCLKLFYSVLIFGSVCAPVSSLSSSVLGPLYFHIISDPVFQFLLTLKKPSPYTHTHTHTSVGILIRIALKLEISLQITLSQPVHEHDIFLHLFRALQIHLTNVLQFSFSREDFYIFQQIYSQVCDILYVIFKQQEESKHFYYCFSQNTK